MNRAELLAQWRREASLGMTGWDFSHLNGRYLPPALPWDYAAKARDFLKPGVRLLDMGTGGGEFLLTLGHPYALTSVTEGWPPQPGAVPAAPGPPGHHRQRVRQRAGPAPALPGRQLRPGPLPPRELRPAGGPPRPEKRRLLPHPAGGRRERPAPHPPPAPGLPRQLRGLQPGKRAPQIPGRRLPGAPEPPVLRRGPLPGRGRVVYQMSVCPWECPGFSVDRCQDALFQLQDQRGGAGVRPQRWSTGS